MKSSASGKSSGVFNSLQSASSQLSTSKQLIADSSQYRPHQPHQPQFPDPYSDYSPLSEQFSMVPDLSSLSISDSQSYLRPSQVDCDSDFTSIWEPNHLDRLETIWNSAASTSTIKITVEEQNRELLSSLKFLQVCPRQETAIGYGPQIPGFSWNFNDLGRSANRSDQLSEMVKEIKQLNSLAKTDASGAPIYAVHFNQSILELNEQQLDALLLSGHEFDPTDCFHLAMECTDQSVKILTWMRTKAGFNEFDESHAWHGQGITASMFYDNLSLTRLHQQENIEKIMDLVFDKRYWTSSKDEFKFPLNSIRSMASIPNHTRMLEWFLNRGQYRYPMPQFTLKDRLHFGKDVKRLAERGKNGEAGASNLSLQLAKFIDDNSLPFIRTLPPPVLVRSNL